MPWTTGGFLNTRIFGSAVCYQAASRVLTNGASAVEATVSIASQVSANALMVQMRGQLDTGGGAAGMAEIRYVSGYTFTQLEVIGTGGGATTIDTQAFQIPNRLQTVYYILSSASNNLDLDVLCYTVPNGS